MTTFATRPVPTTDPVAARGRPIGARLAGLDGLRAIAVVLVMLFHLLPGTMIGGYVGVDLFFVISGFLITGLLVRERRGTGGIRLRSFWVRRARRLLPALALVLVVCSSFALLLGTTGAGDVLVGLGRQLLGATTFSYNWLDIGAGAQYFSDSTPELFRNLWSLAVEEQFYLVWPLVVLALLGFRKARTRLSVVLLIAALSLAAMVTLFAVGSGSTRVYYSTDTHSFGLAIGAALAIAVDARPPSTWPTALRRTLPVAGLVALAGVVLLAVTLSEDGALVYRGGLALVAVLTAVAIAACIAPNALLGRALDLEPIRWVGKRSFGLYLWHWPLYVLLGVALPQFTGDRDGLQLLGGAAACLTVIAATLSYRFVETPIRTRGFRSAIGGWATRAGTSRASAWRAVATSALLFAVVTMTGLAIIVAPAEGSVQRTIAAGERALHHAPRAAPVPAPTTAAAPAGQAPAPSPSPTAAAPTAMPTGDQITAIGDSVMVGVAPQLQDAYPGIDIHAEVSRQFYAAPALITKIADKGRLRPVLLVGLGTNGPVKQDDLDKILALAGPDRQLVLVNSQAPRGWTKGVNRELASFAASHHNVWLADWHTAIHDHLNLLYDDKIHAKSAAGGRIYAQTVTEAFTRMIAPPAPVDLDVYRSPPTP